MKVYKHTNIFMSIDKTYKNTGKNNKYFSRLDVYNNFIPNVKLPAIIRGK